MTHNLQTQTFTFEGKTFKKGVDTYNHSDDKFIIEHSENDGYALMRRGFEHHDEIIMSVEEARKQGKYKKLIKEFEESDFKKELIRTN